MQLAKVFVTCKNYQRQTPTCKYWILKVLCFESRMVCSGWLKNDSLCLRLQRSSKCCVASRCNGLWLDIQRPDQADRLQPWEQPMHYALMWILSWHRNSERISWSGTQQIWRWWDIKQSTDRAILTTFTATYDE